MEPSAYIKDVLSTNPNDIVDDDNAPFSFLEWKNRTLKTETKETILEYNEYVAKWFKNNKEKPLSRKFLIRQKFLYLLEQLDIVFNNEEKNKWYSAINLADEKELLLSIPFFAKKLKQITLYYLKQRKSIGDSTTKHSKRGSQDFLETELKQALTDLLKNKTAELSNFGTDLINIYGNERAFDRQTNALFDEITTDYRDPNSNIQTNGETAKVQSVELPDTQELEITIQELYDNKNYFDVNPNSKKLNNTVSPTNIKPLTGMHEWAFNPLQISVSDNFDDLFINVKYADTGVTFGEQTDEATYLDFIKKYININVNKTTRSIPLTTIDSFSIPITQGNNFFYFPYGGTILDFLNAPIYPTVPLSSFKFTTNIDTPDESPTAGETLPQSDVILVKTERGAKAAWLRHQEFETRAQNITFTIAKNKKNKFIFPFAGYGLSGNNFEWTGYGFNNRPEYYFLNKETKNSIETAYWTSPLPTDTCEPIYINQTNLFGFAQPHTYSTYSDQIHWRQSRTENNRVPETNPVAVWLYKFEKTALPISNKSSANNEFLWPYTLNTSVGIPSQFSNATFEKICKPTPVTELDASFFTAGIYFDSADAIYKLPYAGAPTSRALECAWLSGKRVIDNNYSYILQEGFNCSFEADKDVEFIWSGPSTNLARVFKNIKHRADCNILSQKQQKWQDCTCKQVYVAPFAGGAPDSVGDRIRHKTNNSQTSTFIGNGWRGGKWETPFNLEPGQIYVYTRGSYKYEEELSPTYYINYSFNKKTKEVVWKKGFFDPTVQRWVQTNENSSLTLEAGDIIRIDKKDFLTYYSIVRRLGEKISSSSAPSPGTDFRTSPTNIESDIYKFTEDSNQVQDNIDRYNSIFPTDGVSLSSINRLTDSATLNNEDNTNQNPNTSYIPNDFFADPTGGTFTAGTNFANLWMTYDIIPVVCGTKNSTLISWPEINDMADVTNPQKPPVSRSELTRFVGWTIKRDEDGQQQTLYNSPYVNFTPPVTGTYTISVTAVSATTAGFEISGSEIIPKEIKEKTYIVTFPTIPKIKAVDPYEIIITYESIESPTAGFVLEQQLYGWNYNIKQYDSKSKGAKPYWADLDLEKNSVTRQKSLYSWGYPDEWIDDYLPNTIPVYSNLSFNYGNVITFDRKGETFDWNDKINYKLRINKTYWCKLSADLNSLSNLATVYNIKNVIEPLAKPMLEPTDIELSNLIDGGPVEVYYYAMKNWNWLVEMPMLNNDSSVTNTTYISANFPWLGENKKYPTIASIPSTEELYDEDDSGGYFTPKYIARTKLINKDFEAIPDDSIFKSNTSQLTLDTNLGLETNSKAGLDYLKGTAGSLENNNISNVINQQGNAQQSSLFQSTEYKYWSENNIWMKENNTSSNLAGSVKKSLTENLQTFIPYQSNNEQTSIGLVTPSTILNPWGGHDGREWIDTNFEPKSFTGVRNVDYWAKNQISKQTEMYIDCYVTDIFGNEYGLYKPDQNVKPTESKNIPGKLWVKMNSQNVRTGTLALSSLIDCFRFDELLTYELTTEGPHTINCYNDVLFIKTSSVAIFSKIDYDYDTDTISTTIDNTRYKLLNGDYRFEQSWFAMEDEKVLTLYSKISGDQLIPEIWELDLVSMKYEKPFPHDAYAEQEFLVKTEDIKYSYVGEGTIYINEKKSECLVTYTGTDKNDSMSITEFLYKTESPFTLKKVDYYTDILKTATITEPPYIETQSKKTKIVNANNFSVSISAFNYPSSCKVLNAPSVTATIPTDNVITFAGSLSAGLHHVNYTLSNSVDSSTFCLTLSVI